MNNTPNRNCLVTYLYGVDFHHQLTSETDFPLDQPILGSGIDILNRPALEIWSKVPLRCSLG